MIRSSPPVHIGRKVQHGCDWGVKVKPSVPKYRNAAKYKALPQESAFGFSEDDFSTTIEAGVINVPRLTLYDDAEKSFLRSPKIETSNNKIYKSSHASSESDGNLKSKTNSKSLLQVGNSMRRSTSLSPSSFKSKISSDDRKEKNGSFSRLESKKDLSYDDEDLPISSNRRFDSKSPENSVQNLSSSLAGPRMFLMCKYKQYKKNQQETSRRKATEKELHHLNQKIVSIFWDYVNDIIM